MKPKKKMNTIRVKPVEGRKVKHPSSGVVLNGEIDIESSKDLKRLIRFGDVEVIETKKKKEA